MEFTTLAQKMLTNLEEKMSPEGFDKILAELNKEYEAHRLNDLVNAGDIYRAAEAVGIEITQFE